MSNKITQLVVDAFTSKKNFKRGKMTDDMGRPTDVIHNQVIFNKEKNISELFLCENKIAVLDHTTGELRISNAGWESNTTKERLNGLQGVSIGQKNWEWFLNGEKWNGDWIEIK